MNGVDNNSVDTCLRLAEIFGIIAGFLFATAGLFYINASDYATIDYDTLSACQDEDYVRIQSESANRGLNKIECFRKRMEDYGLSKSNSIAKLFGISGLVFTINALLLCLFGILNLRNNQFNNLRWGLITIVANLLLILLFYILLEI